MSWPEAITAAMLLALAHHMGLTEKAAEVASEIAGCQRCCVFWGTLVLLAIEGTNIIEAAAEAIALAYLCEWLGLLLTELAMIHERIWKRQRNRSRGRNRTSQGR